MRKLVVAATVLVSFGAPAFAWDGTDEEGNSVEISRGELVRRGRDIDVFNYGTGEYETYTVEGIHRRGNSVEVEVFDYNKGEYRTFDMEDD